MPESSEDGPIAPRRTLGGPILPPPPPELAEQAEQAEQAKLDEARRQALKEAQQASREQRLAERDAAKARKAEERAQEKARQQAAKERQKSDPRSDRRSDRRSERSRPAEHGPAPTPAPMSGPPRTPASTPVSGQAPTHASTQGGSPSRPGGGRGAARRSRRAQLRLVQIDAWSVMKTAFLLSIALGIVLVVAVAIIWGVLGAAGVWDSINSIVQQAVGSETGTPFHIQEYAGTSRVLGFTMIVAVIDVILITAIATLGAFLYNLAAALLGGIEVTLAEDS
jgi:hypothetical protein